MHLDRLEIRSNSKWKEKRGKGGKGEKYVSVGARSPDTGHVWNIKFDDAIQHHRFQVLISDPCTYILHEGDEFVIVTIWVDDLLLFVMMDELIEQTKAYLEAEWELTDLGEPVKIVGIEITMGNHSVTISQCWYLESVLQKKGMERANPVGMPLNLNVTLELNPDGGAGDR